MGIEAQPRVQGRVVISEDLAPLYIVRVEGVPTDAQFDEYLAQLTRITMRYEIRALIYDASHAGTTPPSHRRKQAEWMKRHEEQTRLTTAGCAFVLPSTIMRGVLTAILWLQPMACPHTVVARLEDAITWSRERLRARQGDASQLERRG